MSCRRITLAAWIVAIALGRSWLASDAPAADPSASKRPERAVAVSRNARGDSRGPELALTGRCTLPEPLTGETEFEFVDTPLVDVCNFIAKVHRIEILIDRKALEEDGLDNPPVNEVIAGLPLHRALTIALRPLNLTWYVEDGLVYVTTPEAYRRHLVTESYDVAPLLRAGIDAQRLRELLLQCTSGTWATDAGTLSFAGNVLVVRQTYHVQREIADLLRSLAGLIDAQGRAPRNAGLNAATLQTGPRRTGTPHAEFLPASRRATAAEEDVPRVTVLGAPENRLIEEALQSLSEAEFADTPLRDAMLFMSDQHNIHIRLDERALREEGISPDHPMNFFLSGVPLRVILRETLRPLGLKFLVRDGVLWVTTDDVARSWMKTVVYDVRSLQEMMRAEDVEQLPETIRAVTQARWRSRDGVGGAVCTPLPWLLVVRQTDACHDQIADLLRTLRNGLRRGESTMAELYARQGQAVTVRYYPMEARTAQDLARLIPELIAPGTWIDERLTGAGDRGTPIGPSVGPAGPSEPTRETHADRSERHDGAAARRDRAAGGAQAEGPRSRRVGLIRVVSLGRENIPLPANAIVDDATDRPRVAPGDAPAATAAKHDEATRRGARAILVVPRAVLVVRHTNRVHRQIERLLEELQGRSKTHPLEP